MNGGSQNTVSQQTVPNWLQPYLTQALGQGQTLLQGGGPQYYPGQQVAPLTPLQNQGISGVAQTAAAPNATDTAQAQNRNIESGAYLNPNTNPYLSGTFNTAAQQVQNNVDSQFGGANRNVVGSAPVQSSAMNQLANEIYGGAYQTGMQNIVNSQYAAPTLDQSSYLPSQELLQTGAGVQGQEQNLINAAMQKYNYQQQLPENMLSWYSGIVGQNGAPFSSGSTSGSSANNPWLTGAGLGIAGLGAAGSAGLFSSAAPAAEGAAAAATKA